MKPGPKPAGEQAWTPGERQARLRVKKVAGAAPLHSRRSAKRRSRAQQCHDAVNTPHRCLNAYQAWHHKLPASLAAAAIAERLATLLELREHVEAFDAAEPPNG